MNRTREKKRINLLIVDDHKVVRDGIRFILGDQREYSFRIHEASDLHSAMYFGTTFSYDVILMDLHIKEENGIAATKAILEQRPSQNILAFTVEEDKDSVQEMVNAGAKGYLLKDSGSEEIIKAIEVITEGKKYFSNEVALLMMGAMESKANDKRPVETLITERELQVLELIGDQMTNVEIAKELGIKKNTVDDHRKRLLSKLGLRNTAGLIRFAMVKGLIS